jgi:hypothetical protein
VPYFLCGRPECHRSSHDTTRQVFTLGPGAMFSRKTLAPCFHTRHYSAMFSHKTPAPYFCSRHQRHVFTWDPKSIKDISAIFTQFSTARRHLTRHQHHILFGAPPHTLNLSFLKLEHVIFKQLQINVKYTFKFVFLLHVLILKAEKQIIPSCKPLFVI